MKKEEKKKIQEIEKLLKLKKFNLDNAQLSLSSLQSSKQKLLRDLADLDKKLSLESGVGVTMVGLGGVLENYAKRIDLEKEKINQMLVELDKKIESAHHMVVESFKDFKSMENIYETLLDRERIERNKKAQKDLDEISQLLHNK